MEADISGDIPVNCLNKTNSKDFGYNKRKNSAYFKGNMGIFQFKRKFSAYFPNTVKPTFSFNSAVY
jgi:hypothetical protein